MLVIPNTRFSSESLCYVRVNPAVPTAVTVLKVCLFAPGRSWVEENMNKSKGGGVGDVSVTDCWVILP